MNLLGAVFAMALQAQSGAAPPAASAVPVQPPGAACTAAEHGQFDFWLGQWEVSGGPDGKQPQGRSQISKVASGCALLEVWTSLRGTEGRSLNVYNRVSGRWQQFWTGGDGSVLLLEGGLQGPVMELIGEQRKADGSGRQLQRIRWSAQADGSVRQHWEASDDAGQVWQTQFLGVYRRVK